MYAIHGTGTSRILEVDNSGLEYRRFKQVVDGTIIPVKFKRIYNKRLVTKNGVTREKITSTKAVAVVSDTVMVYKKPNHIHLHKQIMLSSRMLQVDASTVHELLPEYISKHDTDYMINDNLILENMLEYDETI